MFNLDYKGVTFMNNSRKKTQCDKRDFSAIIFCKAVQRGLIVSRAKTLLCWRTRVPNDSRTYSELETVIIVSDNLTYRL